MVKKFSREGQNFEQNSLLKKNSANMSMTIFSTNPFFVYPAIMACKETTFLLGILLNSSHALPMIWHYACILHSLILMMDYKEWSEMMMLKNTHNQIQNELALQMDYGNLILLILHAYLPGKLQLKHI